MIAVGAESVGQHTYKKAKRAVQNAAKKSRESGRGERKKRALHSDQYSSITGRGPSAETGALGTPAVPDPKNL